MNSKAWHGPPSLADNGNSERATEMADEVFWEHDPEQRLVSWHKLNAWFEAEGWSI